MTGWPPALCTPSGQRERTAGATSTPPAGRCGNAFRATTMPSTRISCPGGTAWAHSTARCTLPRRSRPGLSWLHGSARYLQGGRIHDAGRDALQVPARYGAQPDGIRQRMGGGRMTEAIIVAALGLVGTLVGSYLANRKSTALSPTGWSSWSRRSASTTIWWSAPTHWRRAWR